MNRNQNKTTTYYEVIDAKPSNFVRAYDDTSIAQSRQYASTATAISAIAVPSATVHIADALQTHNGSAEKTSGMDRSLALVVRVLPFSIVWLVLSVGVSWSASMGHGFTLVLFASLTAITYGYLDRQEREYSRNGLERFKVATLAKLKHAEMDHQQELRQIALEATLKLIERRDGNGY